MAHSCPIDRPCMKKTWAMQVVAVVSAGTAAGMASILTGGAIDGDEVARFLLLLLVTAAVVAGAVWRIVYIWRVGSLGWSELAWPAAFAALASGLIVLALVFAVAG